MNYEIITSYQKYLNDIANFPFLSKEEEDKYSRLYRDEGDLDAAQLLITSNLRFVVKVANDFKGYVKIPVEELVQEGNIGLMKAIKKFDPDKEVGLRSYAIFWIKAYIREFILKNWNIIKIGTTEADRAIFFNHNHVTDDEVYEMLQRKYSEDSIYDSVSNDDEDLLLLDTLQCDKPIAEQLLIEYQSNDNMKTIISNALDQLTDREKICMINRYMSEEKETLESLASKFGVSRERVRQIDENAKRKLHNILEGIYEC